MSENKFLTEHGLDHYTSLLKDKLFNPNNGKLYTREQVDAAINDVKQLALGTRNAYSFNDYREVYDTLASIGRDTASSGYVGGNIFYIKDADSQNLDILNMLTSGDPYYDPSIVSYDDFLGELEAGGPAHIGYFTIGLSETAKVDFTDLVGINDYMSYENYGIGKVEQGSKDIEVENGVLKSKKSGITSTTVKIGNINAGTDLSEMTAMEILQEMLAPYIPPTVSLSVNNTGTFNLLNVPTALTTAKVTLSAGSVPLTQDIVSVKLKYDSTQIEGTLSANKDVAEFTLTGSPQLTSASTSKQFIITTTTSNRILTNNITITAIAPIIFGDASNAIVEGSDLEAGSTLFTTSTSITCEIGPGIKYIAIPDTLNKILGTIVNTNTGGNEYNVYTDNGSDDKNYQRVLYKGVYYKVYAANVATNNTIKYNVTLTA